VGFDIFWAGRPGGPRLTAGQSFRLAGFKTSPSTKTRPTPPANARDNCAAPAISRSFGEKAAQNISMKRNTEAPLSSADAHCSDVISRPLVQSCRQRSMTQKAATTMETGSAPTLTSASTMPQMIAVAFISAKAPPAPTTPAMISPGELKLNRELPAATPSNAPESSSLRVLRVRIFMSIPMHWNSGRR